MVEDARVTIHDGVVQGFGEMQNTGHRVFRHRQRIARTSRGRHHYVAAPEIASAQIAGARGTLMKPFQLRCPDAQIERKWPAAKDDFRFGEKTIAFLAGSRPRGAWSQVACRG